MKTRTFLFCAFGLAAALHAEDYAITSFAGSASSAGSIDGSSATFNTPSGIAIDSAKNLYVTDTGTNIIRKITPGRVVSTLAGLAGASGSIDGTGSAARFNFPVGIAVDASGNIYVAEVTNSMIRKITPTGVVTTFAGAAFQFGSADGIGSAARFNLPYGLAIDSSGNLYVADGGNHTIRKITSSGMVSTLAGAAQQSGFVDGTGSAARFNTPWGVTVDTAGNVYVADSGNNAIRKVTAAGVVTTVAGVSGAAGSADGSTAVARFNQPRSVSINSNGDLFVLEFGNSVLRQIAGGTVTSLAGTAGVVGAVDSVGATARFYNPSGVVADGSTVFVADTGNNQIRRGVPASTASLPTIVAQPLNQTVNAGQSVSFGVVASGSGLTYQWLKNGFVISGANSPIYAISSPTANDEGSYSVRIAGTDATVDSAQASLTVVPAGSGPITSRPLSQSIPLGQSVTFSVTATGGATYQWSKNGLGIAGATGASYAISSVQASDAGNYAVLVTAGSSSQSATAQLVVIPATSNSIAITTQPTSQTVAVGQSATFTVAASGSGLTYQWQKNGSAISGATNSSYTIASAQTGDAGSYTVVVSAGSTSVTSAAATLTVNASTTNPPAHLINLSILTSIASAGDNFTLGYVVGNSSTATPKPLIIRAVGPGLAAVGVTSGFVDDPKLELFAGPTKTGENDNWGGSSTLSNAFASVGAFPLSPASLDAATLGSITTRDNSVKVSATSNGTGLVIAEVYDATPSGSWTTTGPRLINVSVLKQLGSGFTIGFVIRGDGNKQVVVRAVGPGLANVGVTSGFVADPKLTLFGAGSTTLGSNDDWGGTAALTSAFSSVGAFAIPSDSKDAAVLANLASGDYTVQVSANGSTAGLVLVEVYEVP